MAAATSTPPEQPAVIERTRHDAHRGRRRRHVMHPERMRGGPGTECHRHSQADDRGAHAPAGSPFAERRHGFATFAAGAMCAPGGGGTLRLPMAYPAIVAEMVRVSACSLPGPLSPRDTSSRSMRTSLSPCSSASRKLRMPRRSDSPRISTCSVRTPAGGAGGRPGRCVHGPRPARAGDVTHVCCQPGTRDHVVRPLKEAWLHDVKAPSRSSAAAPDCAVRCRAQLTQAHRVRSRGDPARRPAPRDTSRIASARSSTGSAIAPNLSARRSFAPEFARARLRTRRLQGVFAGGSGGVPSTASSRQS